MLLGSSEDRKRYDVAISFLVRDLPLAQALYEELNEGLDVFFYPRNQEELAGTDGLESMREPFLREARISLVLYREAWGNTPWTRVEATAIKEACLDQGWDGLFFFMVDSESAPPRWLPRTHVRFNHSDFSLEQAVGAIKARVQEQGGRFKPLTPLRKAELYRADEEYRFERSKLNTDEGIAAVNGEVKALFAQVEGHCQLIADQNLLDLGCEWSYRDRSVVQGCVISGGGGGVILNWYQPSSNTLRDAHLAIQDYDVKLILQSEMSRLMYLQPPKPVSTRIYLPELSRARYYGWAIKGQEKFISTGELAETCVINFVDAVNKRAEKRTKNDR